LTDLLLLVPPDSQHLHTENAPPLQALGVGYIAAYLREQGLRVAILDAYLEDLSPEQIAYALTRAPCRVLGISLQSHMTLGATVAAMEMAMQSGWRPTHITAGGHFATVCDEQLLTRLPWLDSVVRGEGEETALDLVRRVLAGRDWRTAPGLSFRRGGKTIRTSPRPLERDLDKYPWPSRWDTWSHLVARGGVPSMSSARGCWGNCSFCCSTALYRDAIGPRHRTRSAKGVADEIEDLTRRAGPIYFQFVDDTFLGVGTKAVARSRDLAHELAARRLPCSFSIEARADATLKSKSVLPLLRRAGLQSVSLGAESGVERALKTFNKRVTAAQNLQAVGLLTQLGIGVTLGFIFFDPYATTCELRQNLDFLKSVKALNPSVALPPLFTELLTVEGLPLKEQLEKEGLLRGDAFSGFEYSMRDERGALARRLWRGFREPRAWLLDPYLTRWPPERLGGVIEPWDIGTMEAILDFADRQPLGEDEDGFLQRLARDRELALRTRARPDRQDTY